jgi:hypothetical protein
VGTAVLELVLAVSLQLHRSLCNADVQTHHPPPPIQHPDRHRSHKPTHLANEQRLMKEYLVRMLYCEMLGTEVEFGYFQAIKMAQSTGILQKRVG